MPKFLIDILKYIILALIKFEKSLIQTLFKKFNE